MKFNLSCAIFVIYFVGLHALQEHCSDDSDCSSQNAVCLDQQCQCDNLSYSSSNNSLCLSYVTEYQGICYEDEQCEWVGSNSSCINNQCMCKEGYRWYKGKCQTYSPKGGACNNDDDCYDGYNMLALTCKSGECKCSSGYYDRGGDCRVESRIFLECAINSDCKPFLFVFTSTCGLGKCKNSDSSNTTSAAQKLNKNINNAVIMEKNAGSMSQTSVSSTLVSDMSQISSEEECKSKYHNTKWFKNATCICEPGFFLYNGTCTAELGMLDPNVNYTSDSDCPLKPGKLKNKVCYCKDYWFYDDNNRECIKTTLEMTRSCLTNEWCRAMGPYAFCNSTTSQCQCNSFATYNNETAYCEKSENETISVCLKDSNCPINERCLDEQCACVENFSRSEDGTCLPDIGGSCAFRSCSHIGNSSCVNEVCTCDDNFIGSNITCYPVADSLGTTCEIDEQCEKLRNSGCRTSSFDSMYNTSIKTCICNDGYSDINGTCYQTRKYGDLCSTRLDCTIVLNESFECRNNLCQCPVNYQLVDGYCSSGCFTIRTSLSLMLLSVVLVLVF